MNQEKMILKEFTSFTKKAMPLLFIKDNDGYESALHLLETLFDNADSTKEQGEQYLISILSQAISIYENTLEVNIDFETELKNHDSDTVVLRILIEQNNLKLDQLPEIGHKSLLCKILSGDRQLTKNHIQKLSERFSISPGIFFN